MLGQPVAAGHRLAAEGKRARGRQFSPGNGSGAAAVRGQKTGAVSRSVSKPVFPPVAKPYRLLSVLSHRHDRCDRLGREQNAITHHRRATPYRTLARARADAGAARNLKSIAMSIQTASRSVAGRRSSRDQRNRRVRHSRRELVLRAPARSSTGTSQLQPLGKFLPSQRRRVASSSAAVRTAHQTSRVMASAGSQAGSGRFILFPGASPDRRPGSWLRPEPPVASPPFG